MEGVTVLRRSSATQSAGRSSADPALPHNADQRGTRYDNTAVDEQVRRGARVQELHGPAGTVIVFETSSVHRGMPCLEGSRVAITNYYGNRLRPCGAPPPSPSPAKKKKAANGKSNGNGHGGAAKIKAGNGNGNSGAKRMGRAGAARTM